MVLPYKNFEKLFWLSCVCRTCLAYAMHNRFFLFHAGKMYARSAYAFSCTDPFRSKIMWQGWSASHAFAMWPLSLVFHLSMKPLIRLGNNWKTSQSHVVIGSSNPWLTLQVGLLWHLKTNNALYPTMYKWHCNNRACKLRDICTIC